MELEVDSLINYIRQELMSNIERELDIICTYNGGDLLVFYLKEPFDELMIDITPSELCIRTLLYHYVTIRPEVRRRGMFHIPTFTPMESIIARIKEHLDKYGCW